MRSCKICAKAGGGALYGPGGCACRRVFLGSRLDSIIGVEWIREVQQAIWTEDPRNAHLRSSDPGPFCGLLQTLPGVTPSVAATETTAAPARAGSSSRACDKIAIVAPPSLSRRRHLQAFLGEFEERARLCGRHPGAALGHRRILRTRPNEGRQDLLPADGSARRHRLFRRVLLHDPPPAEAERWIRSTASSSKGPGKPSRTRAMVPRR